MSQAVILVEQEDAVRRLVLNRPDKLNAFNRALQQALLDSLHAAQAEPACKAVLITGAGRAFSAGQDLAERVFEPGVPPDLSENLVARYNPIVLTIRSMGKPVVAAVNGVAAGASANIALACDVVLAAKSARFIQPFSKIGIIPDAGGTWTLPRLVGDARARALAFLAEPVDAATAEQWGMIWRTVDDDALLEEAMALCRRLAAVPGDAIALAKQAFLASPQNGLEEQLALEASLQRQAGLNDEYRQAIEKFRSRQ